MHSKCLQKKQNKKFDRTRTDRCFAISCLVFRLANLREKSDDDINKLGTV